jgi:hypothetical protein
MLGVLLFCGALCSRAQTNGAVGLRVGQITDLYGYFLFASGPQATNFVLESSKDLGTWTVVHQAIGWPGTNPVFRVMDELQIQSQGFWRAIPGEAVATRQQRWHDHEPVEYTFRFRHMISFWEGGVRGTVRVRNGTVIEVTDAVDDRTSQPIPQPDPAQFLSIDQLFVEIRRAFEAGAQQVQVTYDPI